MTLVEFISAALTVITVSGIVFIRWRSHKINERADTKMMHSFIVKLHDLAETYGFTETGPEAIRAAFTVDLLASSPYFRCRQHGSNKNLFVMLHVTYNYLIFYTVAKIDNYYSKLSYEPSFKDKYTPTEKELNDYFLFIQKIVSDPNAEYIKHNNQYMEHELEKLN